MAAPLQTLVREIESSALRQLGMISLAAYRDPTKGLLGVEFVPESLAEEQVASPAAGLGPSPPRRGDEGLQELPLQIPPEPCSEASLASIGPRYIPTERPRLSESGTPMELSVVCGLGYAPARGSGLDADQAVCDNGKWVFRNGLDCRRTCTVPPEAALQPRGAYVLSFPDWDFQGRMIPGPTRSLQAGESMAAVWNNAVGSNAEGDPHGTAIFVRCADGFAAGRGQEGAWMKCADGKWRLERPMFNCHRVCPDFPQLGQAYTVTGEGQHQGDDRQVSCSRGFYPQRRTHRVVCSEGSWPALPFTCSRAMTPDLREGVAGFQKILQQMFSREGVLGFIVFSILVLAATLIVILCWLFRCRGRARRRQRERAEALQALKMAGVPMTALAAVARARLGLSTGSSSPSRGEDSCRYGLFRSQQKHKLGGTTRSDCDAGSDVHCQEMVDLSRRIPARPPGDAVPPPSEGGPTGRSNSQRDLDESTPVPEWLAEERVLPAQAFRRAPDPRCYSAAPALLKSFSSTPGFTVPTSSSSSSSADNHQTTPQTLNEASLLDNDAEVELMHSRDEDVATPTSDAAAEQEQPSDGCRS